MRITLNDGDRRIDIRIPGAGAEALRRAEGAARRLIAALSPPAAEDEQQAFGFSLSADTERADPPPLREHDIEQDDDPDTRRTAP